MNAVIESDRDEIRNSLDNLRLLIDERDTQYKQQFAYQEKAVATALAAAEKAVTAAMASSKEAIGKAEAASEKRFESINEFRKTLSDQTQTFIPRIEADMRYKSIDATISILSQRVDAINNKQIQGSGQLQGAQTLWTALAGLALLIIAIASFAFNYIMK
jgi:hypothetical protein